MSDITGIINDELRLTGSMHSSSFMTGDIADTFFIKGEIVGMRGPKGDKGDKGDPGTTVYTDLTEKPKINGVTLEGNQTFQELGLDNLIINCGTSTTVIGV